MKTWTWIVRGILSIAFGALTLFLPAASIGAMVVAYGVYAFTTGAIMISYAFSADDARWAYVLRGLLGLAAGVVTFVYPGMTAISLYILIGAWAVTTGVMELATAIAMRDVLPRVGGLVVAGILTLAFGAALLVLPRYGVSALLGLVAAYAFLHGVTLISIGVRVHELFRPAPRPAAA